MFVLRATVTTHIGDQPDYVRTVDFPLAELGPNEPWPVFGFIQARNLAGQLSQRKRCWYEDEDGQPQLRGGTLTKSRIIRRRSSDATLLASDIHFEPDALVVHRGRIR